MPVTLRDIARRADVSHATVSVVLNNRSAPVISEQTRIKVLRVAAELGYQPNYLARALAMGRSHVVALWVAEPYTPYYCGIIAALNDVVRDKPYDLMVIEASNEDALPAPGGFNRSHWPVDGIIAIDSAQRVTDYMEQNPCTTTPVVCIGRERSPNYDSVSVDARLGVNLALDHLHGAGYHNIALLTSSLSVGDGCAVRAASQWTSDRHTVVEVVSASDSSRDAGRDSVLARLSSPAPVDAIVAVGDLLAVGAAAAIRQSHRGSPPSVAIVSTTSTHELAFQWPAISAIDHPILEMCRLSWDLLQARLDDSHRPVEHIGLVPVLIVR